MNANLYSLFERHFPDGAEQPFLVIPNGPVVHYDDLAAASAQVANALVAAGCRPGDRVAAQVDKHWHVARALPRLPARRARLSAAQHRLSAQRARLFLRGRATARDRLRAGPPGRDRGAGAPGATVLTLDELFDRARNCPEQFRHRHVAARRPRGDPLHVGDDRTVEGRDAHASQSRVQRPRAGGRVGLHARRCAAARAADLPRARPVRRHALRAALGLADAVAAEIRCARGRVAAAAGDGDDGRTHVLHAAARRAVASRANPAHRSACSCPVPRRCSPRPSTPSSRAPGIRFSSGTA